MVVILTTIYRKCLHCVTSDAIVKEINQGACSMDKNYLEPNQKLEYDKQRHDFHWNTYKDLEHEEFPALNSLGMPIIDSTKQGDAFPTFEEQFTPTAQDSGNWELDNGASFRITFRDIDGLILQGMNEENCDEFRQSDGALYVPEYLCEFSFIDPIDEIKLSDEEKKYHGINPRGKVYAVVTDTWSEAIETFIWWMDNYFDNRYRSEKAAENLTVSDFVNGMRNNNV